MNLEELIKKLKIEKQDIDEHNADYCYIEIKNVEQIIEYLEQLKVINDNL